MTSLKGSSSFYKSIELNQTIKQNIRLIAFSLALIAIAPINVFLLYGNQRRRNMWSEAVVDALFKGINKIIWQKKVEASNV